MKIINGDMIKGIFQGFIGHNIRRISIGATYRCCDIIGGTSGGCIAAICNGVMRAIRGSCIRPICDVSLDHCVKVL